MNGHADQRHLRLVPASSPAAACVPAPTPARVTPRVLLREVLGGRLRRARRAQGRSLRDVAAAAGVSIGHLSQVERGRAEASSEVLDAVCRALGLPLAVLLRAVVVDLTAAPATLSATALPRKTRPDLHGDRGHEVRVLAA